MGDTIVGFTFGFSLFSTTTADTGILVAPDVLAILIPARSSFAPLRSEPFNLAPLILAPRRLAPLRLDPSRLAPLRLAFFKSAQARLAFTKLAFLKLVSDRLPS